MRYAHLSPGFLSDEVKKLDTFSLSARSSKRATKGQRAANAERGQAKGMIFPNEIGSPHWTISATGCGWAWRPAKENENRGVGQNGGAGSGEIEISHGASEAEQLFDPERA